MNVRQLGDRGSAALGYVGVLILLFAACGGWYATWRHYHYGAPTPACTAANLHLSIGTTDGTAGTQYTHLVLANQGNASCTVAGFPAVFLTDASNNPIGSGAGLSPTSATQVITLNPGKMAHVVVAFPDHENFSSPGTCGSASTNIELYLPAATTGFSAPIVEYNCPGFTTTAFTAGS